MKGIRRNSAPARRHFQMLHTQDLSVLEEISNSAGGDLRYMQLEPGRPSASILSTRVDNLTLQRERWERSVHIAGYGPADLTVFGIVMAGEAAPRFQGRDTSSDDLLISNPGDELDFVGAAGMDFVTLFVSSQHFREMTQVLDMPNSPLVDGTASIPLAPREAQALRRLLDQATTEESDSLWPGEDACRLLEGLCLATKDIGVPEPVPGDLVTRTGHARRAREYIEEHLHQPVRLEDICTTAGVGIRTLQRCFKELYGMTPTEYLTARRLDEVRRVLMKASPEEATVTATALDYGFQHLGRFSVAYKSMFGESPSASLRAA